MAKFTPFLGNISGKLKSVVFAYNKGGQYIRAWRASNKPASVSQLQAQALFASAVSSWHSLSSSIKQGWNTFATTIFHAKHPVTGMSYSGYNAFVSMKNLADNMALKVGSTTISDPITAVFTGDFFQAVQSPPVVGFSAAIKAHDNTPLDIFLNGGSFSLTSALFTGDFNLIGNTGVGITGNGPNFADAIGDVPVGIAIYASKPGQQTAQFVQNPEFGLIAISEPIGQISTWTAQPNIQLEIGAVNNVIDRKQYYVENELIQVKAFLVGKNGQSMPIGATKLLVSA